VYVSSPFSRYLVINEVISSSPRELGSIDLAKLEQRESKKYNPVIAKFEIELLGFSMTEMGRELSPMFRTPYWLGSETS
jgi:hypothetical protein